MNQPVPPNKKPCPYCDSLNTKKRNVVIEVGSPINWQSRRPQAPRYRTKEATALRCLDCGYDEQFNKTPGGQ